MGTLNNVFKNINKKQIGAEYFKQKVFRAIAKWFREFVMTKYSSDDFITIVKENKPVVVELQDYLLKTFTQEQIKGSANDISKYISSVTESDINNLAKKIYFQIPEYRPYFDKNKQWLIHNTKEALIAFDSFVYKLKNNIH